MAIDWLKLQNEYLQTPITLRGLAKKHGISSTGLQKIASLEGWAALKHARNVLQASVAVLPPEMPPEDSGVKATPAGHSERIAKLLAISDQLTDQLARATGELDKQILKHKRKTKELVYDGPEARGKPVEETVEENYKLEIVDATVNCTGLQKLSATLRNLRDVAKANGDETEGVEMVTEIMKKLDGEAAKEDR